MCSGIWGFFFLYFKSRSSKVRIGTGLHYIWRVSRVFWYRVHILPAWKISRALPQTGKFMSKVEEKPSEFFSPLNPTHMSWQRWNFLERSWSVHYQNKSDPEQEISKLQNLLCWGEKKHFIFRQLYCAKSPWGSQTRADRAFTTGTWYSYQTLCPNSWESKRWLKMFRLGSRRQWERILFQRCWLWRNSSS